MSLRRRVYFHLFGADGPLRRLGNLGSVLDIGCSDGRGSELLAGAAGCDIFEPALRAARDSGRRRLPVVADLRWLPYASGSFDTVVALDVIEHFEKPEAVDVMEEMCRVARRRVALLTPSGFVPQPPTEEEPWQQHRSGFVAAELRALGFEVVGVGGLPSLRSGQGAFRAGPLGQLAGALSALINRNRPDRSFHLFAYRDVTPQ